MSIEDYLKKTYKYGAIESHSISRTHGDFKVKKCPQCNCKYEYIGRIKTMHIYKDFPGFHLVEEICPRCKDQDVKIVKAHTMN